MTEREGDALVADKAAPFIVNFEMVDTNKDGKVTEDEFKQGCKNGWVQEQAARLVKQVVNKPQINPPKSGTGKTSTEPAQPKPQ